MFGYATRDENTFSEEAPMRVGRTTSHEKVFSRELHEFTYDETGIHAS
jgi:hypothetical protein